MRVLALETSGIAGSVAVFDDQQLVEVELDPARRTAQTLAPTIDNLLRQMEWEPQSVNLIAVTQGPGSFTGLRIGITTAKTLAYATGAAVLGVNTLSVIAAQSPAAPKTLWAVMNAEREQLFVATFKWLHSRWTDLDPIQIVDQQTWLAGLTDNDCVSGPGLVGLTNIPAGIEVIPKSLWTPRATTVGREGLRLYSDGQRSDWWSLLPNYCRESAAVEKARK